MSETGLNAPNVREALERSKLWPPTGQVRERLAFALDTINDGPEAILEITKADWATEDQGTDVLVVLVRDALLMIGSASRSRFRRAEPIAIATTLDRYRDLVEDDEMAGASVVFLAKDGHKPFLLSFETRSERDRMFHCLFMAHRGDYSAWGMRLDSADYLADFERYLRELRAEGPASTEGWHDWIEARYGQFDGSNALGLAAQWRYAELSDAARPDSSLRRAFLVGSLWAVERHPEARRVLVRVGEQMYDEGLLGPPYDERTYHQDAISHHDAGPARLNALMTLAALATNTRDPRAAEWTAAARRGIATVPPSVYVPIVRELWEEIEPLPEDKPIEHDIWADPDVMAVTRPSGGGRTFDLSMLSERDREQIEAFMEGISALATADGDRSASPEAIIAMALTCVRAYEGLSPMCPPGWRKLVVYQASEMAHLLWDRHEVAYDAAMLAQWVSVTIESQKWGPDGNATPLGQHHSYVMNLAGRTGIGILKIDPSTGLASAPTGDEARHAARTGAFTRPG
jgi:hypothetical protein